MLAVQKYNLAVLGYLARLFAARVETARTANAQFREPHAHSGTNGE
jgi:hypothetical protein